MSKPFVPGLANAQSTGGHNYHKLWIHAERDAANVDLLASLLQDAPQLILQLYIMAQTIPAQALQGEISQTCKRLIFFFCFFFLFDYTLFSFSLFSFFFFLTFLLSFCMMLFWPKLFDLLCNF